MPESMTVKVDIRGGRAALVTVGGDVDEAGAKRLDALVQLGGTGLDLVVDLSGVSVFDTLGLRVLHRAWEACLGSGGSLMIRTPSSAVREVLAFGIDSQLTIVNTPPSRQRRRRSSVQLASTT
jgi:anti-anti-sigma factor